MRRFLADEVISHLPDYRLLYCQIPLLAQAFILSTPNQTKSLCLLRMILILPGLYYSYQVLKYDFLPRDVFRMQNWMKNITFLFYIHRILEWGLANESNRPRWVGYGGEEATGKHPVPKEKASLLDWQAPIYAASLMNRYGNYFNSKARFFFFSNPNC